MLEDGIVLDIIRLLSGTIILAYASYTDIKTRRASNMLWIILGSIGAVLLLLQYLLFGFGSNLMYLIFIPIMIALMYALFQLRLIFGGADAKALMALAILAPIQPRLGMFPLWSSIMPFSWVIFSNSIVLFLFIPLSLLIYNIAKRTIQFPYCVLGYKTTLQKAKQTFVWPLEKIRNGKRKFSYMPKEFDIEQELQAFEQEGIEEIWVTPKIPFMIPLLAGFITAFFLGDILSHFLQFLM
jgi:preflagellin peptidase FlaK